MSAKDTKVDTQAIVKKTSGRRRPWIIAIILIVVALYCVFGLKIFTPEVIMVSKNYGRVAHQVTYDKNNITEEEINYLAGGLTKANFFDETKTKYVYIKKAHGTVEINISCNPTINADPAAIQFFSQLQKDMQKQFEHNKIVINLVIDNYTNVIRRIE